jgi:hypothetical protein
VVAEVKTLSHHHRHKTRSPHKVSKMKQNYTWKKNTAEDRTTVEVADVTHFPIIIVVR